MPSQTADDLSETSISPDEKFRRVNNQTIEERFFQVALIMIEGHFTQDPPIGRKTALKAMETVKRTMDKTLSAPSVRETLAQNVDIWLRIKAALAAAIPTLAARSLQEAYAETMVPGTHLPTSSAIIAENYETLLEDLSVLNYILVAARNMLAIKEVAQDICAATQLDKQVTKLMVVCMNVTSKGYDGDNVDANTRKNLNEVTELFKKILVTSLQFLHNLTMGNDRLKMAFWFEMLFDNDLHNEPIHDLVYNLRVEVVYEEVRNWLRRNNKRSLMAEVILAKHAADTELGNTAGPLPPDDLFVPARPIIEASPPATTQNAPIWNEKLTSKEEQDRLYGRVSHEVDTWWRKVRDANYDGWIIPMETVDGAMSRQQACQENAMTRYIPRVDHDNDLDYSQRGQYDDELQSEGPEEAESRSIAIEDEEDVEEEEEDEGEEEEEDEDDESYVEGPLRGLLTEIPNILDTKQIEALHMTVKACVVDAMGSGLTKFGENLQKTRCKLFLALDCGKNLLRELLVFIAVWEQAETQFVFQITAQIIESFHHNALLPYAWNSLRILKDIVSPAQTVLLRLINYMFRARKNTPIYSDAKDYNRDAKLIHFLYNYFRCRVVPDCVALIYAQAQIRSNHNHPQDFPVDLWDMERAKDGLSQYLDFVSVIADIPEMRPLLVEWEAVYELISLLDNLEAGVARKPLVEPKSKTPRDPINMASASTDATISDEDLGGSAGTRKASSERPYDPIPPSPVPGSSQNTQAPGLPPLHDTPHKFPWTGIKVQILMILTSLVAPPNGQSGPGNATVQKQMLKRGGIIALLNCCAYDGHNEYLKERATLCIKWVMDGSEEAQQFVRDLSPLKNQAQKEREAARVLANASLQAKASAQANNSARAKAAAAQAPSQRYSRGSESEKDGLESNLAEMFEAFTKNPFR